MNDNFSVRPEDFRDAWANAYQTAVLQVVEMHKRADDQLKAAYVLSKVTVERSELSRTRLLGTASVIVEQLGAASDRHERLINSATVKLLDQANRLQEQNSQLRDQMNGLMRKLSSERAQFEKTRTLHFNQPLWRRLWNALENRR